MEKKATKPVKKKPVHRRRVRPLTPDREDFFDQFRSTKLCQVPVMNPKWRSVPMSEMRPRKGTYLDYKVSQTETKMEAGNTKIHVRQMTTKVVPLPPGIEVVQEETASTLSDHVNPLRNKYFHGRGPVWVFREEIYAKKIKAQQEYWIKEMKARQKRKRLAFAAEGRYVHDRLLTLCGPDWFQELSPTQLDAVDSLKMAIETDLKMGNLDKTKNVIGILGIVLRPRSQHVKLALDHCCKCPIEFLLTLYQLMNPKRESYSLNDRLLLSAVVHLTIRSTLKEMHIRLPSPPRSNPVKSLQKKNPKIRKGTKYDSPYLEQFEIVRVKEHLTSIYFNQRLQIAESPYFDYLNELKLMKAGNFSKVRVRSREMLNHDGEEEQMLDRELVSAQDDYDKLQVGKSTCRRRLLRASIYHKCPDRVMEEKPVVKKREPSPTQLSVAVEMKMIEEFDEDDVLTKITYKCDVDIKEGSPDMFECQCLDADVDLDENQDILEDLEDLPHDDATDAVVHRSPSSVCAICFPGYSEETADVVESVQKPACQYVIGNTVQVAEDESNCNCRRKLLKRIEDAVCQCDQCKEDREAANRKTTMVISGTSMKGSGAPVSVISDVKSVKICTCVDRFQKRMNEVDRQKMVMRAQERLRSTNQTFVITGVATGPDGKLVYSLGGVAPKRECSLCVLANQRDEEERQRIANMPNFPQGRQKYVISGVVSRPEGNVYNISGAVPIDDCKCMELFDKFADRHSRCMQLYEAYLRKILKDTEEYKRDMLERNISYCSMKMQAIEPLSSSQDCLCTTCASQICCGVADVVPTDPEPADCPSVKRGVQSTSQVKVDDHMEDYGGQEEVEDSDENNDDQNELNESQSTNAVDEDEKSDEDIDSVDDDDLDIMRLTLDLNDPDCGCDDEYSRYMILEEMPRKWKDQECLVKVLILSWFSIKQIKQNVSVFANTLPTLLLH